MENGVSIQPAQKVVVQYRSLAVVVIASHVQIYQTYDQNNASETAPENYLIASETNNYCPLAIYTNLIHIIRLIRFFLAM